MSDGSPRETPADTARGASTHRLALAAKPLHLDSVALIGFPVVILALTALICVLLVIAGNRPPAPRAQSPEQQLDFAEVQQRLMANISHELRTPLNVALGYSEMLKDGTLGQMTQQQTDAASESHEAGRRILRIVTDILDIGRARSYSLAPEPRPLDAKEFVERVEVLLEGEARAAEVSLRVEMPDDLPAVAADERRFKQLVYHLLVTSLIRSSPGQSVSVSATPGEGSLRITVTAAGPEMARTEVARVFSEAPETIAEQHALAPNAVGLPLCAALARNLGGSLSITSGPEGTDFVVELPLAIPE